MQKVYLFTLLFFISATFFSFNRDLQIEQNFPLDLRNRVVGARLQMDGHSPYFYKWSSKDGIRYFDNPIIVYPNLTGNSASPFFNLIFSPIANYSQRSISFGLLICNYLGFLAMLFIGLSLCNNKEQKIICFLSSLGVLYGASWLSNIYTGQYHIILGLLLGVVYFFIKKYSMNKLVLILAGLIMAICIYIKITIAVLLLPLFIHFVATKKIFKQAIYFILPFVAITIFNYFNTTQNNLWKSYFSYVKQNVSFHLDASDKNKFITKDSVYTEIEGFKYTTQLERSKANKSNIVQNSNLFIYFPKDLNIETKQIILNAILVIGILLSTIIFLKYGEKDINSIFLFGYFLLIFTDLLTPFYRHTYYASQWAFGTILLFINFAQHKKYLLVLLLIHLYFFYYFSFQQFLYEVILGATFFIFSIHKKFFNTVVSFLPILRSRNFLAAQKNNT